MFNRILHKILCKLGFHKMRTGAAWSRYKRLDCCYYCNYDIWVEDKAGWLDMQFRFRMIDESRKVLLEKLSIEDKKRIEREKAKRRSKVAALVWDENLPAHRLDWRD